MVLFPNCKINLGLHVLEKRTDGYHNLETVFFPLSLKDALEINACPVLKHIPPQEFELNISGLPIPGDPSSNLCTKAWQLIKKDFPGIAPVKMHLLKAIPPGGGLAGGSSNGAFTLMLLNELFDLKIGRQQLMNYALRLGSDCPFFIVNKPCFASGRGELLEDVQVDLSRYKFVLVHPGIHIDTAWAFSRIGSPHHSKPLKDAIQRPVASWKNELVNDFEAPVFAEYHALAKIKESLYTAGAEYASLTGTGSCVFGIFHKDANVSGLDFGGEYKVYHLHPGSPAF